MNTQLENKEDIFGSVISPALSIADDVEISVEKLQEPLYDEGAVVRCFCFGCGTSTEITLGGAEHLAKIAGVEIPALWQGLYFKSHQCIVCGKDYKGLSLHKIP